MQVIDLGLGSPNDIASLVAMDRFDYEQRQKGGLGYGPLEGMPEAKDAEIKWEQEELGAQDLTRDNVSFGAGSRLLLVRSFGAFFAPGDEIALIRRFYNGHMEGIEEACLRPVIIQALTNAEFVNELDVLGRRGRAPKGVVFCNVPNPGGETWTRNDLGRLAQVSSEHGILVFEDYAYGPLHYTDGYAPSLASIDKAFINTVCFRTSSKMFGLAGYGLGFAVANTTRIQQILKAKKVLAEGGCKPAQLGLASAFNEDRQYIVEARNTYRQRAELTTDLLRQAGMSEVVVPDGGMFGWYPVPVEYLGGSVRLAAELSKRGVVVRNDRLYGGNSTHIRWCFRVPDEDTQFACEQVADLLKKG